MTPNYISAYFERIRNNHEKLLALSRQLTDAGCHVFTPSSGVQDNASCLVSYLVVQKDGKSAYVGFSEVPYSWYIGHKEFGLCGENGYDLPFTYLDVISLLTVSPNIKIGSHYVGLL